MKYTPPAPDLPNPAFATLQSHRARRAPGPSVCVHQIAQQLWSVAEGDGQKMLALMGALTHAISAQAPDGRD